MYPASRIAVTTLIVTLAAATSAQPPTPTPQGQQVFLPETDPSSLRKSQLGTAPGEEVIRIDVDKDGDIDVVESWWSAHRSRWFDHNDDMAENDSRGDMAADSVQIDRDGDGYYDGPADMNISWVDDDGDGDADLQSFAINPNLKQRTIHAADSHWMVFVDVDDDNVHGYVNYDKDFAFDCWRLTDGPNFSPDYNGNTVFLKEHRPVWAIEDPRLNWENPFAFYDMDGDGVTEMAIRHCDAAIGVKDDPNKWYFDGKIEEGYVTYDLDNDAQRRNEMDFDLTFRFSGGEFLDYSKHVHKHPNMKAPEWVLPFYRMTNWLEIDELVYVPHSRCYAETWSAPWGYVWLTFDEDDDDHRWERVELLYPEWNGQKADPYSTKRWNRDGAFGLNGHPQSDTLGDRGEYDSDFSGKGKVYVGKWDGKLHLYGAEWGAWTVDEKREYWGSSPVAGDSSPRYADKVQEVVQYRDTDGNGFIDEITYDYDGDKSLELTVSLLGEDEAKLYNPARLTWEGMHELYGEISENAWQESLEIYRAAWRKGMTDKELDDLAIAASTAEKYEHAYWLKEKVFRRLDEKLKVEGERREELRKLHFGGDVEGLVKFIGRLE